MALIDQRAAVGNGKFEPLGRDGDPKIARIDRKPDRDDGQQRRQQRDRDIIEALPAYRALPAGVSLAPYGDSAYMSEMFLNFALAALYGLVAVYAVLVLLLNDWLQPLSIMLALPLALGGAAAALLLTGHSLNLSTVIGVLMLFGIVGKNSILMVDFIIEARARGVSRREAILSAGRERARPIVMTTLAMVGGMLPAAIGSGSDDGFRAPMAIAVIGGLITSTALSLLLVPVVYSALDDFESWLKRQLIRGQRTRAPAAGKLPDTPISNGQVFENGRVLRREIASLRSQ